jgi:hypothetical protein
MTVMRPVKRGKWSQNLRNDIRDPKAYLQHASSLSRDCVSLRHVIPLSRMTRVAVALSIPESIASAVKNHPRPIDSKSGCIVATTAADRTHRVMLPAAAAVLGFSGDMSTMSVLCVWTLFQSPTVGGRYFLSTYLAYACSEEAVQK